jgi:hypothetical protein
MTAKGAFPINRKQANGFAYGKRKASDPVSPLSGRKPDQEWKEADAVHAVWHRQLWLMHCIGLQAGGNVEARKVAVLKCEKMTGPI